MEILSRDDIRFSLYGNVSYKKIDENKVNRFFWRRFEFTVEDERSFIIDNCHLKEKYIKETIAKLPISYDIEFKLFPISYKKAKWRNIKRWLFTGKWIPLKYLKTCEKNYNHVTEYLTKNEMAIT